MRLPIGRACSPVAAAVLVLGLSAPAHAAFVQYNDRSTFDALGPFVSMDWGNFGPEGTVISTPDSRIVGGVKVGVASSQGELRRYDEGSAFIGNFAVGDHLLGDAGSESDSFIVRFSGPIKGFGTQVDSHYIRGPYTGSVELFSSTNVSLFTASFAGTNNFAEDNTAPFVGITSDFANISYAIFSIDQPNPNLPAKAGSLLINRLDIVAGAVPEPTPLAIMGVAFLSFFSLGFMRRKADA